MCTAPLRPISPQLIRALRGFAFRKQPDFWKRPFCDSRNNSQRTYGDRPHGISVFSYFAPTGHPTPHPGPAIWSPGHRTRHRQLPGLFILPLASCAIQMTCPGKCVVGSRACGVGKATQPLEGQLPVPSTMNGRTSSYSEGFLEAAMPTGVVKSFNEERGFGFITPDDGGKGVFVHVTEVRAAGYDTPVGTITSSSGSSLCSGTFSSTATCRGDLLKRVMIEILATWCGVRSANPTELASVCSSKEPDAVGAKSSSPSRINLSDSRLRAFEYRSRSAYAL